MTDNLLKAGNTLTQRCFRTNKSEVVIKIDIKNMSDGQKAGLCHYSKAYAMLGVTQSGKSRKLEFRTNKEKMTGPVIKENHVWIKSVWGVDGKSRFSYSTDGKKFIRFGELYQLEWGYYRGSRIGIYCFNNITDMGYIDVDKFVYSY